MSNQTLITAPALNEAAAFHPVVTIEPTLRLFRPVVFIPLSYGALCLFFLYSPHPKPALALFSLVLGITFAILIAVSAAIRYRLMTLTLTTDTLSFKRGLDKPREIMPLDDVADIKVLKGFGMRALVGAGRLRIIRKDGYKVTIPDVVEPEQCVALVRARLKQQSNP